MMPAMGLVSWIGMGLLAGAVARYLTAARGGCLLTIGVGVLGAVAGGALSTALGFGGISGFDVRSFVIATLGSILLLLVVGLLRGKP